MFPVEFQAVVLAAGKGSRMPEVTTEKPKCLLPVGSKPLIYYPLHKLQASGFTEAIVIVLESQKSQIEAELEHCDLEIQIQYFTISNNEDLGTADALRLVAEEIKTDVVVVSCDLITDVNFKDVFDVFRLNGASMAMLLFLPQNGVKTVVPGPKMKEKPENDLVGIDPQTNRLVFLSSASDFENDLSLPTALLKKHPYIKVYSNLIDAHFYLLKHWIIKYLVSEESFSTIKGEFLPHIVKKQLAKPPRIHKPGESDIFTLAREGELAVKAQKYSNSSDHRGDLRPMYHGDSIRCYAHISAKGSLGVRVNTLSSFWSINNTIQQKWNKVTGSSDLIMKHPKADIKSTQVDNKCFIWEGAILNEKTSFKGSVIGLNTEISSYSRVFNCIVMNNVKIKERVALEDCVVCDGAVIEKECKISGCLVGTNYAVPQNSEHKQELLTTSDRLLDV